MSCASNSPTYVLPDSPGESGNTIRFSPFKMKRPHRWQQWPGVHRIQALSLTTDSFGILYVCVRQYLGPRAYQIPVGCCSPAGPAPSKPMVEFESPQWQDVAIKRGATPEMGFIDVPCLFTPIHVYICIYVHMYIRTCVHMYM